VNVIFTSAPGKRDGLDSRGRFTCACARLREDRPSSAAVNLNFEISKDQDPRIAEIVRTWFSLGLSMAFLRPLLARFSRQHEETQETQVTPGPFATGASIEIEAQSPVRQRHFWQRGSKVSDNSDTSKSGKRQRTEKMGTLNGVFIPTTLNVLSILMYLRVVSWSR
jgi:hypothetical protein